MIIRNNIPLRWILFYNWKQLVVLNLISVVAVILKIKYNFVLGVPITTVTIFAAALSIYLGFRSNNAYERWWEARIIWGALINYSRAWARQVNSFLISTENSALLELRQRLINRQIAFAHALRVFLRNGISIAHEKTKEMYVAPSSYDEVKPFLSSSEYETFVKCDNPPNYLLEMQGQDLKHLLEKNIISDYRLVQMDHTLVEFNNIQGRSERIKNTAFPRAYSYFQRVFVWTHGILVPFAYASILDWGLVAVSFILNYVFFVIDFISSRTEDPFENRFDDVSLSSISRTVERNLKESLQEPLPEKIKTIDGILF
jgi:putative membrane protein